MNIVAAKKFQEPAELPNTHPLEDIHLLLKNWIRLPRESGSNDFFDPSFPRLVRGQARVNAIAGNYSQSIWNIHRNSLSF
jgi:hypothetical protein